MEIDTKLNEETDDTNKKDSDEECEIIAAENKSPQTPTKAKKSQKENKNDEDESTSNEKRIEAKKRTPKSEIQKKRQEEKVTVFAFGIETRFQFNLNNKKNI